MRKKIMTAVTTRPSTVPVSSSRVPVAEYVRMSDDEQRYSIQNQRAGMSEYAHSHGFSIIKTYADPGKSGVAAKRRPGLRQLISDAVSGQAEFKAVLVYDVSRWGRFPNNDEGAHYEFLCFKAGIPVHYCAEPFANDGTAMSSIVKALKRSMAAEYSRELSEKVFKGKIRLVRLGYWMGAQPGYGLRRLMISAHGKPKQIMKRSERKNIQSDRVILVPGPSREVRTVRLMFAMACEGRACTEIARELNRKPILYNGKPWLPQDIYKIVTNPKYAGWNVWNRGSERLQKQRAPNPRVDWIMVPNVFRPVVDQETFDRANANRPKRADQCWSDNEIVRRVRRLLKTKGRLSETLFLRARGMPSITTINHHFGKYSDLYNLVGFPLAPRFVLAAEQMERTKQLRRTIENKLLELFPTKVKVTQLRKRFRSLLLVDDTFLVSILLCRSKRTCSGSRWEVEPKYAERSLIALICTMNDRHDGVLDYFLLPSVDWFRHRRYIKDSYLRRIAVHLDNFADFYTEVREQWSQKQKLAA
jgi:DNA invertase Pin-like site-specific DNA recombinase